MKRATPAQSDHQDDEALKHDSTAENAEDSKGKAKPANETSNVETDAAKTKRERKRRANIKRRPAKHANRTTKRQNAGKAHQLP